MTPFLSKNRIILITGICLIAAVTYFLVTKKSAPNQRLGSVQRQDLIQKVTIAGTVAPKRRTLVTTPYNGYVKQIFVQVGDAVKAGQPLVSVTQSLQSSEAVFPLRAPYAGTVVQVQKNEGENVKEGDINEYIMRIDDLSQFYVNATAPEIDRTKLAKGQETVIKVSALFNKSYKGKITELALAPKEKSGENQLDYPVRIEVLNKDEQLGSGMSVLVDIVTAKKENVLTLRHEYIHRKDDGSPYVVLATGEKQDIKLGMQNDEMFEIEGLNEKTQVQQVDFSALSAEK